MEKPKYTDAHGVAILSRPGFTRNKEQHKIHALDENTKTYLSEYLEYLHRSKELRQIDQPDKEPIVALLSGETEYFKEAFRARKRPDITEEPAVTYERRKRRAPSTGSSTKGARVGTPLGDVVGNWNAEAQGRDSESLERLQIALLQQSRAKQTTHQDSTTVHGMICALANGDYEAYYFSFLGLILRLCPEIELPRIIKQRLGAILDAWRVLGLDGENRIYRSFPARGPRKERVHCIKQWFGLISSFEESVGACQIRHPLLRRDKLIALDWDEAHDDELLQHFHTFFFQDSIPSTKTQELRQLLQQEEISYHFDRLWLQDLLSKLLQASIEASDASEKVLASFLRSVSDSLGDGSTHGCNNTPHGSGENSSEVMANFVDRLRNKIKSLTEQNVHYQAEIARVQALHANTLSELATTMEMDNVFGSILAVERQKGETEPFQPHDPGTGASEADRLLALATELPERLSHQMSELKDKLREGEKDLEIERQKTRQLLEDLDAAEIQSRADIRQLKEVNQQSLERYKEENENVAKQRAQDQQDLAHEQGKRHECERRLQRMRSDVTKRLSRLCQKLDVDRPSRAVDLWDTVERGMKEVIEVGERKADALISHLLAQIEGRALFLGWDTEITHESAKRMFHETPEQFEFNIRHFIEGIEYREGQATKDLDDLRQENEDLIQKLATTNQHLKSEQQRWDKKLECLFGRNVELKKERNLANHERDLANEALAKRTQEPLGVTSSESARIALVNLLLSQIDQKAAPSEFADMRDWESKAQVGGLELTKWLWRFHPDKLVRMDESIKGSYSEIPAFGNVLRAEVKDEKSGRDGTVGDTNFRPYQLILNRIDRMQRALQDAWDEKTRLTREYENAHASLVLETQTLRVAQESIRTTQTSKEELQSRVAEIAGAANSSTSELNELRELLAQYDHRSHESLYFCYKNILAQHQQQRRLILKLWNQCFQQVVQCLELGAFRNPQSRAHRGELENLRNVDITELADALNGLERVWRRVQDSITSDPVYDVLILLVKGRTQVAQNTDDIQRLLIRADLECLTIIDLLTAIIPDHASVQDLKNTLLASGAPQKTACFERYEPIFCRLIQSLETSTAYEALLCEATTSESNRSHHMITLEEEKRLMQLNAERVMNESGHKPSSRPLSWPTMKPLQPLAPPPKPEGCVEVEGSHWRITGIAMARKSIVVSLNNGLTGELGRIRLLTLLSAGDPATAKSNAEALYGFFILADCPLHPAINFLRCEALVSKPSGTSATIRLRDGGQKSFPVSTVLRWGIHAAHALGDLYARQFRDRHAKGIEWVSHQKSAS